MLLSAVRELRMTVPFASASSFFRCTRARVVLAIGIGLAAGDAHAQNAASIVESKSIVAPPPSEHAYIQYGVALSAEIVADAGPACAGPSSFCILGSGGGVVARAGWRPSEILYVGGAYEMTKQDPHQLYRLGILQQVRAEMRRYFPTGRDASPFLLLAAGLGSYGNEWLPVDTWGPSATLGGGLEVQLGPSVFVVSVAYRPMYLHGWADSSGLSHDAGIAHFVVLEAAVEAQENL
jgi:hypothetical protein